MDSILRLKQGILLLLFFFLLLLLLQGFTTVAVLQVALPPSGFTRPLMDC